MAGKNRETGIYNGTGPAKELGIGGMLDGNNKTALEFETRTLAWADAEFLKQPEKSKAWSDMPVWAGDDELGMSRAPISAARLAKRFLNVFRSLGDTARRDTTRVVSKRKKPERQAKMRAGLTPGERERQKFLVALPQDRESDETPLAECER